ncbi:MAG: hypothetical protein P1U53_01185 [Sulfitobacter sp.]|nr:hypothetical protein [Sulfitobacter sp.]
MIDIKSKNTKFQKKEKAKFYFRAATGHLSEKELSGIDSRAYFATCPLLKKPDTCDLHRIIYTKIRKSIGFIDTQSDQITGIISALDVNGTRNNCVDFGACDWHFHFIILFSKSVYRKIEAHPEGIKDRIKYSLSKTREVAADRQIYVEKLDNRKSIFETIDYALKLDDKMGDRFGTISMPVVFPFEISKITKSTRETVMSESELCELIRQGNVFDHQNNFDFYAA